jgi:hypothetical protein
MPAAALKRDAAKYARVYLATSKDFLVERNHAWLLHDHHSDSIIKVRKSQHFAKLLTLFKFLKVG